MTVIQNNQTNSFTDRPRKWHSVRGIYYQQENEEFREIFTLYYSSSEDAALDKEEERTKRATDNGLMYAGYLEAFPVFDEFIEDGTELYSIIRNSTLDKDKYIEKFIRTGLETDYASNLDKTIANVKLDSKTLLDLEDDPTFANEHWFIARYLMQVETEQLYVENFALFSAKSFKHALKKTQGEALSMVENLKGHSFTGYVEITILGEETPKDTTKFFEICRKSELEFDEYIKAFVRTGNEVGMAKQKY